MGRDAGDALLNLDNHGKNSKLKYGVILLFILAIGYTVYSMLKFEDSLRESRTIRIGSVMQKKLLPDISQSQLDTLVGRSDMRFKAGKKYLFVEEVKIRDGEEVLEWHPHFLKGVNMGVALPGNFPSEFEATYDMYLRWFEQIAAMNSNTIRTYTILPPGFYEAFAQYNIKNASKPLYILQGVWADDADSGNYLNNEYSESFKSEIKKVIDVIHGNAVISEKPGRASGVYSRDISEYVIGILLGREFEPATVIATNSKNKQKKSFSGDFISLPYGNAMEAWLAEMMDFTVRVEVQLYQKQRPVSFVNWLPLDPMFHNSEFIESRKVREYDNDIESVDYRRFNATPNFKAGMYAAYHAYPYYPDYVYLDEKYRNGVNHLGQKDNYSAYLRDLKDNCPDMPLIIAEYGVPSSRGNSHASPFGFSQGGYGEREHAEKNRILTEDIYHNDCGGAVYFSWMDEWFKFNWLVMDFEVPAERRKLWHNMENPEQNFGVIAVEQRTKSIDGDLRDWNAGDKFGQYEKGISAAASSDAEYFYLAVKSSSGSLQGKKLITAIDTYDELKGSHRLPGLAQLKRRGYEFLIELNGSDSSQILVDEPYSVYSDIYAGFVPVFTSRKNDNGKFIRQILISNRERESLTGEKTGRIVYDRSSLIHGNSSDPSYTNSNLFINESEGIVEVRIPWQLLNVSDPSSLQVLDDKEGTPAIESSTTDGFNIHLYTTDKGWNNAEEITSEGEFTYVWNPWEKPEYTFREKETYRMFADLFPRLKVSGDTAFSEAEIGFKIAEWYGDLSGAVSVSFDDGTMSQYKYGLPVLAKYGIEGTFALISEWVNDQPSYSAEKGGLSIEKIGWTQVRELIAGGHEIASHGFEHIKMDTMNNEIAFKYISESKSAIEQNTGAAVRTFVFPYSATREELFGIVQTAGYRFARAGENASDKKKGIDLHRLSTFPIYNENTPSVGELNARFAAETGQWLILNYHNIFPQDSKEMNVFRAHNIYSTYSVTPEMFDRQMRLTRNTGRWIAPISTVGRFIMQRGSARLEAIQHDNKYLVKLAVPEDPDNFYVPMTVIFSTSWEHVKVTGAVHDGTYNPRNGRILINVMPNREFSVERPE